MKKITRSALQPYPVDYLYTLVNDVARYPEFLPWCSKGEVLEVSDQHMVAGVTIAKGPINQRFVTHNRLVPNEAIYMRLVEGPFRHLDGVWRFTALADDACKIEFEIDYEVAGGLFGRMLSPVFEQIASTLVDAFSQRARQLYGSKNSG